MTGGYFFSSLVSEFGSWSDPSRVIDKRIAKADPELRIARVTFDCILENPGRILALSVSSERFRHPEPGLGWSEVAEESVPSLSQRKNVAAFDTLSWSAGEIRAPL